jgi:hypothetical protein
VGLPCDPCAIRQLNRALGTLVTMRCM